VNKIKNWKRYYESWRPVCAPHEVADITEIENGSIWHYGGILAIWTTNFDTQFKTDFWYCIKDSDFDIEKIPSKKRYYIKKGIKSFDIRIIKIVNYIEEIYKITDIALKNYKDYSGPEDFVSFKNRLIKRTDLIAFGAFSKDDGILKGYIIAKEYASYVDFMSMKVDPQQEGKQINAALVFGLIQYYNNDLKNSRKYICDGMRAIRHETRFQDYLISYFGFRYAYCQLNIAYRPSIKIAVKLLFPFRRIIKQLDNFAKIYLINVLLRYEELARITKKQVNNNLVIETFETVK